ncbi:MAG: OB-fold nucleic acid binding domain-containing protein [Mangrovibacterium sp.]
MSPAEHVFRDYASTSLSLKAHPVSFVRQKLDRLKVTPAANLSGLKNGMFVKVCGLITVRQHPSTAKGVLFITIEDETGFANLVVWTKIFEKYRKEILQSRLLLVTGKLQVEGEVIHVVVRSCQNLNEIIEAEKDNTPAGQPAFHGRKNAGFTARQGELFPSRDFR